MVTAPDWDKLNECLEYREATGELIWRKQSAKNTAYLVGQVAGHLQERFSKRQKDYFIVTFGGRRYMAHVLIWFLKTKEFRPKGVDHRDGDSTNNRWSNLRACSGRDNNANQRKRSDNTTGYKGVSFRKACSQRPYYAQINIGGKQKVIGYYATAAEAGAAYDSAAKEIFGDFALTNSQVGG